MSKDKSQAAVKKLRFCLVSQVCETCGFGACFFSNTRPDEKLQILVIFAATNRVLNRFSVNSIFTKNKEREISNGR